MHGGPYAQNDVLAYITAHQEEVETEGWLELIPLQLVRFRDVGLHKRSSDRVVWRFAQQNQMLLLTTNRNMEGANSLQ
jgi:hypothetical protein